LRAPYPLPYLVIAAAAAVLAVFALFSFFMRLRRDRLVADTPAVRIRSAAQGYVKVTGRAVPAGPAPTAAPLSSRPCVWWAYEIAQEQRDSKGNAHWHTVESAASVELFALVDDDGSRCLVGPVSAEITPSTRKVWYGSEGGWRYTERLLGVGERLCVMGELRSHSELGDVNVATGAKLHEWKQDQRSLLARFDVNHDGKLDAAEWEAARLVAARESQTQTLQSTISRVSVISEPVNGEPFLIAPLSASQLEKRERLFAGLYFLLGLIGVIVCAWALGHAAGHLG
jgi:hypothetical protein